MKAERNKTIDISVEEGKKYLKKCKDLRKMTGKEAALTVDKTVIGDNLKALTLIPKGSCDLLITDPPYNIYKDFTGHRFKKKSVEEYRQFTRAWLSACVPALKKTASVYVCCDWESSAVIAEVLAEFFTVRNRITWQREKGRGAQKNWKNGMEDIWFATVSKEYTFNLDAVKQRRRVIAPYKAEGKPKDWTESKEGRFRDTCPSNFWDDISVPYWSMPENTAHPTQKPEKLIAKLILASSNEGDVVLDPFLGAGTTSVTAKKLSRHYIGIEQNPQYCIWAEKRLEMAEEDNTIQGFADGVFWERNTAAEQKRAKTASPKKTC
ncbi:MAG: site-specific DNA-methyltransferase [Lachnospiraceae bacterium]|nr:site-specific DNA-methyltransferase [Lachnospiraceae bacterium]MBP5183722.1 site-specific DNA-methyltransferase [Lachnospiraceae bacterium]